MVRIRCFVALPLLSGLTFLAFVGYCFFSVSTNKGPPITLANLFDDQFDCLEQLTLSLTRSVPYVESLRIQSMAFEDLSYALVSSPRENLAREVRSLSLDIDAFATIFRSFHVEIDVLVHLSVFIYPNSAQYH